MNRLLLLALTAGLLSPIAAKAESEFTEIKAPNPYSYKSSSVVSSKKEGKRYISFKGTTHLPTCFEDFGYLGCINKSWKQRIRKKKIIINNRNQPVWNYQIDCDENTFDRDGDWMSWQNVRLDPTAQTVSNKYCSINSWNQLPLDNN